MTERRKRYDKRSKVAAARVVLGGEMGVVDLAKELGVKDSTLRRWAREHEEMGDAAFPGNGSPEADKDHEMARLREKAEEPGRGIELLKDSRALSGQGRARGAGPPRRIGASSAPSGRHARRSRSPGRNTAAASIEGSRTRR